MPSKAVSFEACQAMYAECKKMIPLLASQKYIGDGEERYCVRDMEFFAQCFYSWKEALAANLEYAAAFDVVFCKIQTALLLRDHPVPAEELYEGFGWIRAWREEIWQARAMFDCGKCPPERVHSFADFRGKPLPEKVTRISLLAEADQDNLVMACESIGIFEPESREALIAHGVRELERLKLQGRKIEFKDNDPRTTELLLLCPWARKNCLSEHTVYGIKLAGSWYCPENRSNPDDQYDCWNDQWYGSRILMLFDYDPDFRYDYSDILSPDAT